MKKIKELIKNFLKQEIVLYGIVGVLTTVVSLAIKYILLFTVLDAENAVQLQIAVIISWVGACLFAYITNRIWVFKSKSKEILKEIVKFFSSRIATLGLEMLIMHIFVTLLKMNVIIWTLVAQVLVIIGNYILGKLVVFKNK
ncbi:MAG: GtrA family protein [Clostridia bacterium]|nr:GtrA family protein [Clostridia bacterium]